MTAPAEPHRARVYHPDGTVTDETWHMLEPDPDVVFTFGATAAEALAALGCAADGHDFPLVEHRQLCQVDPILVRGACTRCGAHPAEVAPLLWNGDYA